MKLEISLFAGLWAIGVTLLTRAQIQGVEGALISMAVEYGLRGLNAGAVILTRSSRWISLASR